MLQSPNLIQSKGNRAIVLRSKVTFEILGNLIDMIVFDHVKFDLQSLQSTIDQGSLSQCFTCGRLQKVALKVQM